VQKGEYTFGIKYSALGISDQSTTSFLLYPNPTQNQITFVAPDENSGIYTLKFVDVQGRVVFTKNVTNGDVFNADLPSGAYVVQLISGDQNLGAMRLVLE
jgi:hypothetical protein